MSQVLGLGTSREGASMLKGEDMVLLLQLSDSPPDWAVHTLAGETSIPRGVVHAALKRLAATGLFGERRRCVNASQAEEFLTHGLQYVTPTVLDGEGRGVPTSSEACAASSTRRRVAFWKRNCGSIEVCRQRLVFSTVTDGRFVRLTSGVTMQAPPALSIGRMGAAPRSLPRPGLMGTG
jgi:hypothetical protein